MAKPKDTGTQKTTPSPVERVPKKTAFDWDGLVSKFIPFIFIVYVVLVIWGVVRHESWADEAQSWLLVKDLSLPDMLKALPSEGHPPLWYLLLYPFAKLGFPYETAKWISGLIMIGAIYILLFKTTANKFLKISVPFSYHILYQYAVFARSYSLVVFFLMLIVWQYPRRFERPWLFALCVAALFNTHMLVFSFTLCLLLLYIADAWQARLLKGRVLAAAIFMALSGLYLIPFFAGDSTVIYFQNTVSDRFQNIDRIITYGLLPHNSSLWIGMAFLLALCLTLMTRVKALFLLVGGLAGILYIYTFRYPAVQPRHYGVLVIVLAAGFCIARFYKNNIFNLPVKDGLKYGYALLGIMFLLQIEPAVIAYRADIEQPYSDAKNLAGFITEHNMENSVIIGHERWESMAILPYLPDKIRLYDLKCERFGRHYVWDSCFMQNAKLEMSQMVRFKNSVTGQIFDPKETFGDRLTDVIMVLNYRIDLEKIPSLELLYSSEQVIYQKEMFNVYRFKKEYIDYLKNKH